jgi:phage protein U
MAFLLLGDIGFGRLVSPTGFDAKLAISYAEHQVIEGKPLLQYTGDGLGEINLAFLFHADFCDPQAVWDDLITLATSHKAFPLSQGNGLLVGKYVIIDVSRTTTYAAEDGSLYGFECKLSLKEYADPQPLETKKQEQQQQAPAKKKPGRKPKKPSKKKEVPQPSAESRQAGYALSQDKQTVIRQSTRQA